MPEQLATAGSNQLSQGSTPRDASPDSLIYGFDSSNLSLFSSSASASASADRSSSSFASDFHDRDPHFFQNGAGPDPRKRHGVMKNSLLISAKGDQAEVLPRRDSRAAAEDDSFAGDVESARNSFSLAVKEFQTRSNLLPKILDCERQGFLHVNSNLNAYSPRLGAMKSSSVVKHCSGALTSPGTPNYRHTSISMQKGWSSERVPLPQNGNRRQVGGAHFPFNHGKTLPSKWEDAERWIFGPVNTEAVIQKSVPPPQRRPRSKSGPLGPSEVTYYSSNLPAVHMFDGMHGGNLLPGTPFSTHIIAGDSLQIGYSCSMGCPSNGESGITRSVSINGCSSELLNHFSMPHSPRIDEEFDGVKDAATGISDAVSRRDMATQMSPESSPCSSSRGKLSTSSALSTVELHNRHSPRLDVRDVEIDERVTLSRWSRKNKSHLGGKRSENVDDSTRKAAKAHKSWEESDTAKSISKVRNEEARIAAWENLQRARAEAAIRKMETKLEKKRSASMDKIMNKLKLAQKKGQEMRRAVLAEQAQQVSTPSHRSISFRLTSLSSCFSCLTFNA